MSFSSFWFYLLLMPLFLFEGWALSSLVPFYRNLKAQEAQAKRILSIDGLRGLLALGVFFLHAVEYHGFLTTGVWLAPKSNFYAQLGVLSVTMFFFITGYVFCKKLMRASEPIAFMPLLRERLGRLGGAYAFSCLVLFLLVGIATSFQRNVSLPILVVQHLAWLSFLGSGHEINRFAMSKVWLGPAWTLRSEWYFYLSLPLLYTFARNRKRLVALLCIAAIAATLIGHIHANGIAGAVVELARSYAMFLAYLFGVGMLVAAFKVSSETFERFRPAYGIAAMCLVVVTLAVIPPAYGPVESLLLALPFALIASGTTIFGLLSSAPMLFLGRISYSFYLLHLLVLAGVGMALGPRLAMIAQNAIAYWSFAAGCGTIAVIVASLSYRYLESPFVGGAKKHTEKASQSQLVRA